MSNVFYLCDDCGNSGLDFGPQFNLECPVCKGKAVYIDRDHSDEEEQDFEDDAN